MLNKIVLILFCVLFTISATAQEDDSLFVTQNGKSWMSVYVVRKAETLFLLARRFHVPPAVLADANGLNYQSNLNINSMVVIPVGTYNLFKKKPVAFFRPIYHRVLSNDNLYRISECSGTDEMTLQLWNNLKSNKIKEGQVLLVGWIRYDETQVVVQQLPVKEMPKADKGVQIINVPLPQDTLTHKLTDFEKIYLGQTNNEANIITEKGPAAFFENNSAHAGNVYYAFHNNNPRGTIIKILNPGNGKIIFAKVLGPLPDTKLYYNCILGLSNNARAALGVNDVKVWCELSYSNQ